MYKLRRVYRTKPGEASNVAKLVYKQTKILQDAGHRGEFTVSYNGYTLPGETNIGNTGMARRPDNVSRQTWEQHAPRSVCSRKGVQPPD